MNNTLVAVLPQTASKASGMNAVKGNRTAWAQPWGKAAAGRQAGSQTGKQERRGRQTEAGRHRQAEASRRRQRQAEAGKKGVVFEKRAHGCGRVPVHFSKTSGKGYDYMIIMTIRGL